MVNNDACTFDIFPHSVKPARNAKRDLRMFLKKRAQYSISHLKLPSLTGKDSKYRPVKSMDPVDNSESLRFNQPKGWVEKQNNLDSENHDLDLVLKNIREALINSERKLKSVSPALIDQIYRFENLNDFSKHVNIEEMVSEHQDLLKQLHKKNKKKGKSFKPNSYNMFGYESTG